MGTNVGGAAPVDTSFFLQNQAAHVLVDQLFVNLCRCRGAFTFFVGRENLFLDHFQFVAPGGLLFDLKGGGDGIEMLVFDLLLQLCVNFFGDKLLLFFAAALAQTLLGTQHRLQCVVPETHRFQNFFVR